MGSITTVRPSDTFWYNDGWNCVGAGGFYGDALSDDLDTTYVIDNTAGSNQNGHRIRAQMDDAILPDGCAIIRITPRVRVAADSNQMIVTAYCRVVDPLSDSNDDYVYATDSSKQIKPPKTSPAWTTYTQPSGPSIIPDPRPGGNLTPGNDPQYISKNIDGFIGANFPGLTANGSGTTKVSGLWVDIEYVFQLVAGDVGLSPTDANNNTSRPTITWRESFTPDGGTQAAYELSVWRAADTLDGAWAPYATEGAYSPSNGGPDVSAVVSARDPGSGTIDVISSATSWKLPQDLPNGDYVVAVRLAQDINGQLHWANQVSTFSWTQNVILPTAPTISDVTWLGAPKYAPQITVQVPNFAAHTPAATGTLIIHRVTSRGFEQIPAGPGSFDGTADQTIVTYDTACRPGEAVAYRAMVVMDDGSQQLGSAWSTTSAAVTAVIDEFLLRDVLDPDTDPLVLQIAGALNYPSDEQVTAFTIPGRPDPVFVSGAVGLSKPQVPVTIRSEADYGKLVTLRALQDVLLLQTDMAGIMWWVRFDATVDQTLLYSTMRLDPATRARSLTLPFFETGPAVREDGSILDA